MAPIPDDCPLTLRDIEVIQFRWAGGTYLEIGKVFAVSSSSIEAEERHALRRLRVADLQAAQRLMRDRGWWDMDCSGKPLKADQTHLAEYLAAFDASRWPHDPDDISLNRMRRALAAHRNQQRKEDAA